jgi:hypothetical protein
MGTRSPQKIRDQLLERLAVATGDILLLKITEGFEELGYF